MRPSEWSDGLTIIAMSLCAMGGFFVGRAPDFGCIAAGTACFCLGFVVGISLAMGL